MEKRNLTPLRNVLVRYLAQDDRRQSAAATRLIEALTVEDPGFIAHATLVELAWVLESCYDATRATGRDTLRDLLRTRTLRLQDAEAVARRAMAIADDICVCANGNLTVERL